MDRDLAPLRLREHPTLAWRISSVVLIACLIVIFVLGMWHLMFATRAYAHDALPTAAKPQGWSYPWACCSGYDCREVPADWIREGRDSITIVPTGEAISYGDTRVKDSPDGATHWCCVAGANDSRTICLFLPSKGM